MRRIGIRRIGVACGLGILIGCLGAGLASAGNQGKQGKQKGKPGGASAQHRSERAQDRSNAQWSEGATRGRERADQVRSDRAKLKGRSETKAGRDKKATPEEKATREKKEAKPAGRPLVDTFITEVSQDTWIYFPWDMELQFVQPIASGRGD